ncbi:hypothetical protein [Erythrobacter aureus]|uniref:Type II secretion system protein n=1 Tax=Erythrobacter aureus TaxID=2182384 RepID=A0A345YJK8_9SPHN|nr:hypothetical protein [Erythrobacter aureus]AXK44110.1 hypothetical protein DVR09_16795 [Erythrobacter aureus]
MSQVLIGIIGVILFIGLALAGAMFLGPRFQESAANSRASAAIQAVTQVAQATNLYMLDEGRPPPPTNAQVLVDAGYLKAVPVNPITSSSPPQLWEMAGGPNHVDMIVMHGGSLADDGAKAVCDAINKQSTGYEGPTPTADPTMTSDGVSGCWRASFGAYYVWAKI